MLVLLSVWNEVHIVCIIVQLMPLHSKTPSSPASFKSRLVLPFRCRFTQVVLEKRPLNGCSSTAATYLLCQERNETSLCVIWGNLCCGCHLHTEPNLQWSLILFHGPRPAPFSHSDVSRMDCIWPSQPLSMSLSTSTTLHPARSPFWRLLILVLFSFNVFIIFVTCVDSCLSAEL